MAIAGLDGEREGEKWTERTTVITKVEHDGYIDNARDIITDIIQSTVHHDDRCVLRILRLKI